MFARLALILRPFYWREALIAVPGIPLQYAAWNALTGPTHAAVATISAFAAAMAATRRFHDNRWLEMLLYGAFAALAALGGTLLGHVFVIALLVVSLLAAICARSAFVDNDLWWIMLQVVVAFLGASYFPGTLQSGLERAGTVLGGALIQTVLIFALARLLPAYDVLPPRADPAPAHGNGIIVLHSAIAAAAVALSWLAARSITMLYDYWAPMTAMLVLKPGVHDTERRDIDRVIGTLAGAFVAAAFAAMVGSSVHAKLVGLTLAAWLALGLSKANYALFSAAITVVALLVISLGNGAIVSTIEHRVAATCIGGVIALCLAEVGRLVATRH